MAVKTKARTTTRKAAPASKATTRKAGAAKTSATRTTTSATVAKKKVSTKATTAKKAVSSSRAKTAAATKKAASTKKAAPASKTGTAKKKVVRAASSKKAVATKKSASRTTAAKTTAKTKPDAAKKAAGKTTRAAQKAPAKKPVAAKKTVSKKPVASKTAAKTKATSKKAPTANKSAAASKARSAAGKTAGAARVGGTVTGRKTRITPASVAEVAAGLRRAASRAEAARAVAASVPRGAKIAGPAAGGSKPKVIAEKTAASRQAAANKKPVSQRHGFKTNEYVVYPAHGVGRIVGIEEQEIAGMALELFVINFEKEKLTLHVPTGKLETVGMRKLAEETTVKKAIDILKGRARVKRTMWSRRAQEYVAKINSGDLISIAEVVRDLYRSDAQPEQSYSERQLYEDALDRMAREVAAVEKLDERGAVQRVTEVLSKSARGRRIADEAAAAEENSDETRAA